MIVTPDDQPLNEPLDSKIQTNARLNPDEPPPSYSSEEDRVDSAASGSVDPHFRTFKTKPTNFLTMSNDHNTIRGEFVIDPSMCIPSALLPPLGEDETEDDRKNLSLRSKSGSVHADVWLLGSSRDDLASPNKSWRTTIALTSNHGSIHSQVHTLVGTAPFALTASTSHGSVRLDIPRSFQGLLSISTRHGSISVSDTIVQNATRLSQLGTTWRYFVGDFSLLGEDEWQGDQVNIDATHGHIRVKYVDDAVDSQGKKGLFSRLFRK